MQKLKKIYLKTHSFSLICESSLIFYNLFFQLKILPEFPVFPFYTIIICSFFFSKFKLLIYDFW
ncbi:hypothetical protein PCK1_002256 [Pneumocystis canis]|nr:hypothetical protein PCK1_002256 [Pneumocystis canis]